MKPARGPKAAARPGGGFRPQGFGHFNEEHLEQAATSGAVQQKQLGQQGAQSSQPQAKTPTPQPQHGQQGKQPAPAPREVSDVADEVVKRPVKDVLKGLKSLFDLNSIVGINPGETPEEQQRKKAAHHRYEQLDADQQKVAKQLFEKEMQKKQQEEEEKEQKKQAEKEKDSQPIAAPSSPKKGPVGMAGMSKKQKATTMLEQQRQSIGRVGGAN